MLSVATSNPAIPARCQPTRLTRMIFGARWRIGDGEQMGKGGVVHPSCTSTTCLRISGRSALTPPIETSESVAKTCANRARNAVFIHVGRKPAAQKNGADDKCYSRKNDRMQSVLDPGVHVSLASGMRPQRPVACPAIFPDFIPSSAVV